MKRIILMMNLLAPMGAAAQNNDSICHVYDSLSMEKIIHELPDVMVKGERPVARIKGSCISYDLPRIIQDRAIDNVYDAVKELPGVSVMDEKLTLAGKTVNVILDGKVSTMSADELSALLKSMPANRIARAEVMYNAPAKMQVRGAVINIVLKHGLKDIPLQGELYGGWRQSHDAQFDERASMILKTGNLSMDLLLSSQHGDSYQFTGDEANHRLDDGSIHQMNTASVRKSNGKRYALRWGMDYSFGENHLLSMVYNGVYGKKNGLESLAGTVAGASDYRSHSWLHNLRMDYTAPFGLKASAEMTYYQTPNHQTMTSVLPTGSMEMESESRQKVNRWKFSVIQEHDLGNDWSLNYGGVYSMSINHSGQDYRSVKMSAGEAPQSTFTRQREDDVNLFAGFSKEFSKKLSVEASLAADYYHSPVWNKWYLYPTLNIGYHPAPGHMLQLSMSTDRTYPGYWEMSDYTTYSSGGYNEITGNPQLIPSTEYEMNLTYIVKNKYQFTVWFTHDDDYFVQTPYQRHDRLAVSYQNKNMNYQQQAGLQVSIPVKAGNWMSSRLTMMGVWMHEKNDYFYDVPYDRSKIFGLCTLNNTFKIARNPDIALMVDGNFNTQAIQATYDLPASGALNVSARWQFLKKHAILKVFCNDILETSVMNPSINYKGQNLKMNLSCYRTFGVSFTYKFGGYKEKQREHVDESRFKK